MTDGTKLDGINNANLARKAAAAEGLIDKQGNIDLDALREGYPELFGAEGRKPEGGAGSGVGSEIHVGRTMNDYIRLRLGYGIRSTISGR